jgi:hypothetical protein
MRMLVDIHAATGRVVLLENVVEEHERTDAAAFRGRQRAQDRLAGDILRAWPD